MFENRESEHADLLCFLTVLQLGHLTLEDYQIWSVKSALANEFLNLLFQVRSPTSRSCNNLYWS